MAAPTAVSMLHAGVLMKLGAFGIIRLGIQMMPEGAEFWMPGLLVLGTINALYGAFSAMAQRDLKFMIGYSSVSHMGYVFMGLATMNIVGINGAVLQMFAHGVMTALFFAFQTGEGGIQFERRWRWVEDAAFLGQDGITLHLGVDGIAAPMVLLTGIVILAGSLVSWKIEHRTKDFYVLLMTLTSGVFGTFVALDLFFFFWFYELAVIPMYLLIVVWGSTNKEYGAMKLTVMLVAASVLIFVAIFAVFSEAGLGTFDLVALWGHGFDEDFQRLIFPLVAIGCGVLGGLWPFHTWSPDGHVAAPTAVSMLHAGVLMKLGSYGALRVAMWLTDE